MPHAVIYCCYSLFLLFSATKVNGATCVTKDGTVQPSCAASSVHLSTLVSSYTCEACLCLKSHALLTHHPSSDDRIVQDHQQEDVGGDGDIVATTSSRRTEHHLFFIDGVYASRAGSRRGVGRCRTPALTHATTVAFVSPLVTSEAFLRHRRTHRLCTKFASKKTPVLSSRPSADNNHSLTRKANGRACFILTDDQQQGTKATPPHSRAGGHCAEDNDHEVSFARRRMIDRGTSNAFVASVLGLGLGLGRRGPAVRAADSAVSRQLEEYCSSDGSFALEYPADFKAFSKPLKTHKMEVNFKSEGVKGYEIGVAVDPVTIESLDKFGTPDEVGARVIRVEQGKDGTLDTKLFGATAEKQGDLSLYTLDYLVESTRGTKHFVAKVTIKNNLLYACTGQSKEVDYPQVEEELKKIVKSFRVPA